MRRAAGTGAGSGARRGALRWTVAASLAAVLASAASAQQGWNTQVVPADAKAPKVAAPVSPPLPRLPAMDVAAAAAQRAAQEPRPAAPAAAAAAAERARKRPETLETNAARQYCVNIADPAADARLAWQKKAVTEMEQELDRRIALLEAKTAEFQKWVKRRDEFVQKARDNLVLIYSRMRPDAAAMQLKALDEETAAAIVVKLDPRTASTILNEMESAHAARLTAIISGAARTAPAAKAGPRPEDRRS